MGSPLGPKYIPYIYMDPLGRVMFVPSGLGGYTFYAYAMPEAQGSLEAWQKEKRDPNDADDAGQEGQHNQHHWGSVSPFLASHAPNDPSLVKIISQPYPRKGLGASF